MCLMGFLQKGESLKELMKMEIRMSTDHKILRQLKNSCQFGDR